MNKHLSVLSKMLRRAVILVCGGIWEGNTRVYNFSSGPSPVIANINGKGRAWNASGEKH
jgi:hypothetical protein